MAPGPERPKTSANLWSIAQSSDDLLGESSVAEVRFRQAVILAACDMDRTRRCVQLCNTSCPEESVTEMPSIC